MAWHNRVVGHGEEAPDQLAANPRNWRIHPRPQADALAGVLDEVGWVGDVLVNRTTGFVVDGHLRVSLALQRDEPTIPVRYVELTEAEEALVLATFDPISAIAATDRDQLDALLRDVSTGEAAVQSMLAEMAEREGVVGFGGGVDGLTDPDDVPEAPEDPITRPGDLWVLGGHRVLCGDSTKADDVAYLLDGDKPALMVTDPPYGVDYEPDWRNQALGESNRSIGVVTNDHAVDWGPAWHLSPSDVAYVWHAGRHASEVQRSLEVSAFEIRCQVIWAKQHFAISRGHYHWQHEPCWYAVRKGATASWSGDRKQTTLWEINNGLSQGGGTGEDVTPHGTQKPVECMARPIRNHEGDVYDPFLGSGTTLIAAEQLDRRCYGIEIDPIYVDVIVRRWEAFTGQQATLERHEAAA